MAVYGWIYANAKRKGDSGDYRVRFCDPPFAGYRTQMIALSRCMLSTSKRFGEAEAQMCWFSGFLAKKKPFYVAAAAGRQEELLNMSLEGGGFRRQYGVFALGFDGDDIGLVRRDLSVFEPLRRILRKIQQTDGRSTAEGPLEEYDYGACRETVCAADTAALSGVPGAQKVILSAPDVDEALWKTSLQRPVMTGILSEADAKKLLEMFPDGVVSVAGEVLPPRSFAPEHGEAEQKILRASGILVRPEGIAAAEKEASAARAEQSVQGSAKGAASPTERRLPAEGKNGVAASPAQKRPTAAQKKDGAGVSAAPPVRAAGPGSVTPPAQERTAEASSPAQRKRQGGETRTAAEFVADLRKLRYGKIMRREIRECAERCRDELRRQDVAAAKETVQKVKQSGEIAEQLFYFCCMQMWIFRQEGRRIPGGKELFLLLQAMEEQIVEKKLLQTNCMLRKTVLRLRGEDDTE